MSWFTRYFRARTEKLIDDVVAKALVQLETAAIQPWLVRMGRRATRDFCIGAVLLLLALAAHFLMADDAVPLALVAIACWYSIGLFVWNRVSDARTYWKHREPINGVARVALPAFARAPWGAKFHSAGEAVYDAIYEGQLVFENAETGKVFQVGWVARGTHRVAAALGLTPNKGELFEQVYAQMLGLFWRLVRSQLWRVVGFVLAYAALTSAIRLVVEDFVAGAHLTRLFDPIVFPVVYVAQFF